jgi:DNA polymerase III subunit epsilon
MHYLVLDIEMTGPEPGWNEIIQIGAVLYDQAWQEKGRYQSLVYPENEESFSSYSEEVHGIAIEDLDDAPMLNEVLPEFEDWILEKSGLRNLTLAQREGHLRHIWICGQSVIYDINFLRFAYRQEKMKWSFANKMLDLHTLSYYLFEILKKNGKTTPKSLSLKAVGEYFGYAREGDTHDALEDAVLTGKCLKKVLEYTDKLKLNE